MYEFIRRRWSIGAASWAVSGLFLPLQVVVAWQWPNGYSIADNAISDLGVTICGSFSDYAAAARPVCSPWHALFNFGVVASGVLIAVGAALLYGRWSSLAGRAGLVLAAVSAVFVITVGLAPWDVLPDVHDLAALAQALTQWAAMIQLAIAAGRGAFRVVTLATVAVSIVSFMDFLLVLEGAGPMVLPLGIAERLAFDTLSLWTASVGVSLLLAPRAGARSARHAVGQRSA
ncbi:DUF998 domain-containing protein [Microbacterium enclense]|uniref:DUF998 domain-containing protein n=1 Tax=Microbacterium enclense TaxID=993073 RepID=UPI003F8160AA